MYRFSHYAGLLLLLLCLALAGVEVWARGETPKNIGIDETYALLMEQPSGIVIVDVRTPAEYLQGHLPGARNLDFTSPTFVEEAKGLPRDSQILLYCRSGTRSAGAASLLQQEGFTKIMNMQGGLEAWQRAGRPLEAGLPAR